MKKRMSRNSSEKEQSPTRRGKRDHRKHSLQTKQTMETTSGVATRSPNPKRETEAQLGLEEDNERSKHDAIRRPGDRWH